MLRALEVSPRPVDQRYLTASMKLSEQVRETVGQHQAIGLVNHVTPGRPCANQNKAQQYKKRVNMTTSRTTLWNLCLKASTNEMAKCLQINRVIPQDRRKVY